MLRPLCAALILAFLALFASGANAAPSRQLVTPLTAAELAWLNSRPVLRLGVDKNGWPPIEIVSANGELFGLSAEVLRQIEAMVPVRFEIVPLPSFSAVVAAAQAGRIDVFASATPTPERRKFLDFTTVYLANPIVTLTRRDVDTNFLQDTKRLVVVVESGTALNAVLAGDAGAWRQVITTETTVDALKALSEGRADVYFGAWLPVAHITRRQLMTNLEVRGFSRHGDDDLTLALRKSLPPEALSVLNKALQSIPEEAMDALRNPLLDQATAILRGPRFIDLSETERAFLSQARRLRVVYDPSFAPFTGSKGDGPPVGLAVDMLNHVSQRLATPIEWVAAANFAQALAMVREKRVDMLAATAATVDRQAYMRFVGPMIEAPTAVVTRGFAPVNNLAALKHKTLALPKGYFLRDRITRELPDAQVVDCELLPDCLKLLDAGIADASLGNLNVVSGLIQQQYLGSLRIAGTLEDSPSRLYVGIRDDAHDLKRLVEKALATLDEPSRLAMQQRWLSVQYTAGLRWQDVLRWLAPIIAAFFLLMLGSLIWMRRLSREVTRREHAEAIMRIARDEADHANRAKGAFLATMSHEIRTPMNGVIGMLDTLAVSPLSRDQQGLVRTARMSAEDLLRLLSDVLDYSKLEADRMRVVPQPTRLGTVIESACLLFASAAQSRGLALRLFIDPHLASMLSLDGLRVKQVLSNLVSNAIKFTERGEVQVIVGVENDTRTSGEPTQRVRIDVVDSGPGLSREALSQIFQPFVQSDSHASARAGGTGLGLAICERLAGMMGGGIRVESTPGKGSRFIFEFSATVLVPVDTDALGAVSVRIIGHAQNPLVADLTRYLQHAGVVVSHVSAPDAPGATDPVDIVIVLEADAPEVARRSTGADRQGQRTLIVQHHAFAGEDMRSFDLVAISGFPLQPSALFRAVKLLLLKRPTRAFDAAHTGQYLAVAEGAVDHSAPSLSTPILVVDDHSINRAVVEAQLTRLGYGVETACDGAQALERWRKAGHVLVITDCHMPGMDGYALTRAIHAESPHTIVIGLSADPPDVGHPKAIAAGMHEYLQKPLDLKVLAQALHRVRSQAEAMVWFDFAAFAASVGGAASAQELLPHFLAGLADDRAALVALREGSADASSLGALAHRIKGAASSAACAPLAELAKAVEKAVPRAAVDDEKLRLQSSIDRLIAAIDSTHAQACQQLQA